MKNACNSEIRSQTMSCSITMCVENRATDMIDIMDVWTRVASVASRFRTRVQINPKTT
jgi:hypothetical protein